MPFSGFLKAINTLPKNTHKTTVVFTGGEPLLRKDIEDCGYELRKHGYHWGLVSNGYLYNKQRHNSLLNAGMGALTLSLDGMAAEHNWLRNAKKSFDKVVEAIEIAAQSKRLNFDVVTCVNQRNLSSLGEIYHLLKNKSVSAWRLFTIAPIGRARINKELLLLPEQFKMMMDFIVEYRAKKEMDVKFSCEGFVGEYENKVRDSNFFCRAGINIGSVLIDGSISACPNIDRQFTQGNIYTDNFFEVWQNRFQPFRNRNWTKTDRCATCSSFNDCLGNGFHYRKFGEEKVLVCHKQLLENSI